jgi:hypothetical protein
VESETWTLTAEPLDVTVDLTPRLVAMAGGNAAAIQIAERVRVDFNDAVNTGLLGLDGLYAELVDYKVSRGYGNVFIPRGQVLPILRISNLFMHQDDLSEPEAVREGASKVLNTYLDRFVARKEREAESRHLEPGLLKARERIVPYKVRVSSEELLKEIEALLRKPREYYSDGGKPLPRLHVDRHLFSPVLLNPEDFGLEDVSVSPLGLGKGERRLVEDLRDFWRRHHREEPYRRFDIHLVRNLPRVGVGFFRRSGFYPDFILWLRDRDRKSIRVHFLEPHGTHHGGLGRNQEKIEGLKEIEEISRKGPFRDKKIALSGYILTETKLEEIPDAGDKTWETLERDYRVLHQEGAYIRKILATDHLE